jgi:5-methylcytosine-specific restriction endonuclease McrA
MTMNTMIPSRLSDHELVTEVTRLVGCEREATASLIASLAELYGRRLHQRAGFSSLFTYCTEVLHLSEHEAYDRMKAAKVVRRYPAVLGLLASGHVNLTTVRLLAPHLTRKNHEELFAAASGKRKRQLRELLARWFPKPDVASSVRKLRARHDPPAPIAASTSAAVAVPCPSATEQVMGSADPAVALAGNTLSGPLTPAPPRPPIQPLAPNRYRITFTATEDTCEKLQLAQDLLRHAVPNGDPAQVFARALDVLVEDLVKQKYAATCQPRTSRGQASESRHIPADVKRAVFIRDRGRCAFVGTHGRRCGERALVEFHHLVPYAAGGGPTVDNIALRCRPHNDHEAEMFYGPIARARVTDDAFRSGTTSFRSGTINHESMA